MLVSSSAITATGAAEKCYRTEIETVAIIWREPGCVRLASGYADPDAGAWLGSGKARFTRTRSDILVSWRA